MVFDGYTSGVLKFDSYAQTYGFNGAVSTATYTFQVDPVTISPSSQNLAGSVSATIATTQTGATLYYGINYNGDAPASITTPYTSPIVISSTAYLTAQATKPGYLPATASAIYTSQLGSPSFSVVNPSYGPTSLGLQSALTTDGSSWTVINPMGQTNYYSSGNGIYNDVVNYSGVYTAVNTTKTGCPR
jgi:hypothetical protein